MTLAKAIKADIKKHEIRHSKLVALLEKLDYAILGEEPQMRAEFDRIRKNVVAELREEQDIIQELKYQLQEEKTSV
jgi:hypothetical protein